MYAARDVWSYRRLRPRSPWPGRLARTGLVFGAAVVLSLGLARAVDGQAPASYEAVTVQPGDTLWSIAAARYPGSDVRAKIWDIEQANHLQSPLIEVGQTLEIPSR